MRGIGVLRALGVSTVLIFGSGQIGAAQTTIDFDGTGAPCVFASTTPLTNAYSGLGVTFGGNGAILNECGDFGLGARSGTDFWAFNVSTYATGPGQIFFSALQSSVSLFAGARFSSLFTLTAYDALDNIVGSMSATPGDGTYAELSVSGAGIARAEITSQASAWVVDDLSFGGAVAAPEPGSLLLLATGLLGIAFAVRSRRFEVGA